VFSGKVLSVEIVGPPVDPFGQSVRVSMRVFAYWKASTHEGEVMVRTPLESAACGREFVAGESYLVYAGSSATGDYSDNSCTRTVPLRFAESDLAALGSPGVVAGAACAWSTVKSAYSRE
jgi:hypothetical protein